MTFSPVLALILALGFTCSLLAAWRAQKQDIRHAWPLMLIGGLLFFVPALLFLIGGLLMPIFGKG